MKELKKGSKGKDVEKLQVALNAAATKPPLKTDGVFGKLTEAAVRKFQSKNRIEVDGIAAEVTLSLLKLGPKPKPEEKAPERYADTVKENIASLDHLMTGLAETSAELTEIIKFCQKAQKAMAEQRSGVIATRGSLRPLLDEIVALQKDYDKVKTTHLARAAAVLHRIRELEKKAKDIASGFNKKSEGFNRYTNKIVALTLAYEKQ